MTIKDDIKQMFWEPAIDYANAVEPITFETDAELPAQQERWNKVHKAYAKGVEDVLEFISDNYDFRLKIPSKYCKCKDPDREQGQIYCKKCHKDISNGRMKFLANPNETFNVPAKEDDADELRRKLRREYDYHSMCARATLFPGKTIEEVKDILYYKRVEEAYKQVNDALNSGLLFMNDNGTQHWVINELQKYFDYDVTIRCDDTNNPSDVIDQNLLIARVIRNTSDGKLGYRYVDMVFGAKDQVEKYTNQQLLDNETFKFIQKGI
jgi:hypothetical protein